MKKSIVIFIALALLVGFTVVSCFRATPLKGSQLKYAGKWVAPPDEHVTIYQSGKGDFKIGATTVTGGNVSISDNVIKIGLFGINKELTIDKDPYEEDGKTKIRLDGVTFEKVE